MVPIPVSPDRLLDLADRLGVIEAVKGKLTKQPDPAAAKLVTVFEELSKIYGAMEDELKRYLSLYFPDDDPEQLAHERAEVAALEAGQIVSRMEESRGHCSKIWNIYQRYLTPWFAKVLDRGESEQLESLFLNLSDADGLMVAAIGDLADWLSSEAETTGDLVARNDLAGANARVLTAVREVRPLRKSIDDAMRQIRKLEADFIEISGAV